MIRAAEVLRALALADLRLRYGRGSFRMLKWLLDPFFAAGVYLLLVAFVLDRPGRAAGLSIACAIVPFQLVMMTIANALTAVQLRGSIIANMRFARGLIPLAAAVTESLAFLGALSLIVLMMAAYGVAPTAAVAWLPVLLGVTFLLAVAAAYPAALLGLWFPQATPFVISAVRAAFFLAPGVVALSQMQGRARDWIVANPLTGIFEAFRDVFVSGTSPAAWELLYPAGFAVLALAAALPLYRSEQRHFAKLLD